MLIVTLDTYVEICLQVMCVCVMSLSCECNRRHLVQYDYSLLLPPAFLTCSCYGYMEKTLTFAFVLACNFSALQTEVMLLSQYTVILSS